MVFWKLNRHLIVSWVERRFCESSCMWGNSDSELTV
ncbi:unnamed protein product [Gongylonema pulchrum]|uniref:Uncharacterized protein n=1 Tax=Gongylonema pulchrum TaxID=637853 RepID=A0A183DIE8_9BILA|nr:unnamed protein product [Gongylonema pulchrum]